MKRPAVFFDRDNTLIISDGYLGDPAKVVPVDGAADAVARVRGLGFATVVFSNQSGVARGMFGEDAVHAVNARMDELLLDANPAAVVDRHEFCPYHPEAIVEAYRQESPLRKPRPGMITQAAEKLALDLPRSWTIGDAPRDVEAGHAAGCRTILIKDPSLPPSPAANSASDVDPDFVVASLREAVDVIARETMGETAAEVAKPGTEVTATEVVNPPAQPVPEPVMKLVPTVIPPPPTAAPAAAAERRGPARAADETPAPRRAAPAPLPAAPVRGHHAVAEGPGAGVGSVSSGQPSTQRLEELGGQILEEVRRRNETPTADFSVSKLMAGIVQVIALAALFIAYFRNPNEQIATLLVALTLQCFTIALLIMGRQR